MKNEIISFAKKINEIATRPVNLMEFCGTHTHEIFRYGIRGLLGGNVKLLSGPGCPVCVTHEEDIDRMIEMAREYNVGIITFGDMVNVPGSNGSLNNLRAMGHEVHVVYSPLQSIKIAEDNPQKNYVLIGIGFETTLPTLAYTVKIAKEKKLKNFYYFSLNKLTPPAMKALLDMGEVKIDGIIGPGHVSTIIGRKGWLSIFEEYKIPFVISGFEPLDILYGIYLLVKSVMENRPELINAYKRSVTEEGNINAQKVMYEVFEVSDALWRGLGKLPQSGLSLREEFKEFDALLKFPVEVETPPEKGCRCGEVLRGIIKPTECPLFGTVCTPENPQGPCMVSSEGTCSAYYLYAGEENG